MIEDWLHKIHDRLSDYEIEAPDNLWNSIEESLSKNSKFKRHVILMWTKRIISTAALLAFVISLCFFSIKETMDSSEPLLLSTTGKNTHTSADNDLVTTSPKPEVRSSFASNQTITGMVFPRKKESEQTFSSRDINANDAFDSDLTDEMQSRPKSETSSKSTENVIDNIKHAKNNVISIKSTQYIVSSDRTKGQISFAMFTSGGTGSMLNRRSIGHASPSSIGSDKTTWEENPALGILLFNKGQEISTDIKHRLPIRAGITFIYNINKRLGIGSGISYTNLTTDIREGSNRYYYTGEQKLHYIGIPLNIQYQIYSWKVLDIYASAGMLAEKCVSANIDKKYFIDYQQKGAETEKLSVKPVQWSVNSSIGVQCNLIKSLGIYVEPGISYNFNDGSNIQTIYKDKPLNFNLNLGIRFTFGK